MFAKREAHEASNENDVDCREEESKENGLHESWEKEKDVGMVADTEMEAEIEMCTPEDRTDLYGCVHC
jgi:hypothetical protein